MISCLCDTLTYWWFHEQRFALDLALLIATCAWELGFLTLRCLLGLCRVNIVINGLEYDFLNHPDNGKAQHQLSINPLAIVVLD